MPKIVPNTVLSAALAVLPTLAVADVSYVQEVEIEVGGGLSMLNSSATVVTQLSGDKSRSDSEIRMKSKLASLAAGNGESSEIVRLDKGVVWRLQPQQQEYQELSFSQMRQDIQRVQDSMSGAGGQAGDSMPVDADACTFDVDDVRVKRPRGKERIAGIKASRYVVEMAQTCEVPESNAQCELVMTMEAWTAKKVPGQAEADAYQKAYAEALGLDGVMARVRGPAQGVIKMFGGNWEKLNERFEDVEGFPLRSTIAMKIGGENCVDAEGQPLTDLFGNAANSAVDAAVNQAGSEAASEAGRAIADSMSDSIGGRIGGSALGAAAGELVGGLTGMFSKGKSSGKKQSQESETHATLFSIKTEVTEWDEGSIPEDRFEVPQDWDKVTQR